MKRNLLTTIVGVLLLIVFVLLLFVYQVRQNQVAVVTTFGKPTSDAGPGAHFRWPWPIQKVHKFDQSIQNLESPFEQVLTSDGYNLLLMTYLGWTISDPKLFFPSFGDTPAMAEETLRGLLRNAYSGVAGKHPFAHFISTDPQELKIGEIEQEMLKRVQADVSTNNYGIEVRFLGLKKIGLPGSVTEAVFERMRAERHLATSKIQYEGERQASEIRSTANAASARLMAEADAQATRIRALGESEAAKSFEVFKQEPELAKFLYNLGALESFMKEKTVLVLDTQTSPLNLLKGVGAATNTLTGPRGK